MGRWRTSGRWGIPWHYAYGISGNGQAVVGWGADEYWYGGQAFRWTPTTGIQGLGYLSSEHISTAYGISRDGSTVVGVSGAYFPKAFEWTEGGGMVALPDLGGPGSSGSNARAANADGSVIVGASHVLGGPSHAVRWTPAGVEDLAVTVPNGHSHAWAVSDDGNVVAGTYYSNGPQAFVWTPATGLLDLRDFLALHGVTPPPDLWLTQVFAVSADGRTFGGDSIHVGTTTHEGWVATIPTPATTLVLLAAVPRRRRRGWLKARLHTRPAVILAKGNAA